MERLLDTKGVVTLPVGDPGYGLDRVTAEARLRLTIADVQRTRALRVETDDDGTIRLWPAERMN